MKRIKISTMLGSQTCPIGYAGESFQRCTSLELVKMAYGINQIMDYLEHMTRKNGKLFTCVNCNHASGFIGDLGHCCDNPLYEVSE